jgi:hypothetical protein
MTYSFEEHKHRFAVWTAARAVQRSFTRTRIISDVIVETGLRSTSNTWTTSVKTNSMNFTAHVAMT